MSLRARLLLAIVSVNLLVLGALFYFWQHENRRVLVDAADAFRAAVTTEVLRTFARGTERVTIEATLGYRAFDALCRDGMVLNNPEVPTGAQAPPKRMQINPLGAFHRDPATFPQVEIIAGIDSAMQLGKALPVHGGFCMPIQTENGRIIGGGWFLPKWAVEPSLPTGRILLSIGLGVLLLGGILFVGIENWVLRPLGRLLRAARALTRGELGTQVELAEGTREMHTLVRVFNRASTQLKQHESVLAQAVDNATERARRRERELVLSQRLAALGTLAAGIAHEINNPLAGMMNAVNRLKKQQGDGVYIELLEDGLARIGQIVRRTLEFAPRTSQPLVFRLGESVERARALVSHRMETAGVEFVYHSVDTDQVRGDPHELSQVFLNLFLNSLDAFEEGLSASPRIRVDISAAADEQGEPVVRVVIADNGPGTDEETLQRLFDPFFSTKGATSTSEKLSAGLGMSISYSIVEQHGGTMRASAPAPGGFVVEISLPRAGARESSP